MKGLTTELKIDFKRLPYRGILAKLAEKTGQTSENIRRSYNSNDPDVVKMVNKEVKEVHRILREKKQLIEESQHVVAGV